jgi:hypothetical protein
VIEPRNLYSTWEDFDSRQVDIRLGRARTLRSGEDVTIVAACSTVAVAEVAADTAEGFAAEVIDLLTLSPMDVDTVARRSPEPAGSLPSRPVPMPAGGVLDLPRRSPPSASVCCGHRCCE